MTAELIALREENETLRETVRQLRAALAPADVIVPTTRPHLSRSERDVFRCLVRAEIATVDQVTLLLYSDRPGDWGGSNILSVFICKMRRKLRPLGIEIRNVWGVGYRLEGRERFLARGRAV